MTAVETPYHRIGLDMPAVTGNIDLLTGLGNSRCLRQTVLDLARERASDPAPFTI
ncbi:MAG: GGDEF-domain containing protein, partial [Ensifer sp. SSB1]|nr:GGDEF-domain containing protein [Ensifer sp. SSB1]